MALQSKLFQGDSKLDAAAELDSAHITPGSRGDHVRKIQLALIQLDGAKIEADGAYGPKTAAAVLAYKTKRSIINPRIQSAPDNITGRMTLARMDTELLSSVPPSPSPPIPSNRLLLNFKFDALLIDIFVKIEGFGSPQKQGLHDPAQSAAFSANMMANPNYDSTRRFLTSFIFTGSHDSRDPSGVIIDTVNLLSKNAPGVIDQIFLWGGSAGGRNVLTVGTALSGNFADAMQYIALSDPAFDKDDPLMRNPGRFPPKMIKKLWFQTYGQTIDPRKEFHGPVAGFLPIDLTPTKPIQDVKRKFDSLSFLERQKGAQQAASADAAHTIAFGVGLRDGIDDIRRMLIGPKI